MQLTTSARNLETKFMVERTENSIKSVSIPMVASLKAPHTSKNPRKNVAANNEPLPGNSRVRETDPRLRS
jgi:hypothetical protein